MTPKKFSQFIFSQRTDDEVQKLQFRITLVKKFALTLGHENANSDPVPQMKFFTSFCKLNGRFFVVSNFSRSWDSKPDPKRTLVDT